MDFKFARLLLPVVLSFGIVGSQRESFDVQLVLEVIRKCTDLEVGTQVGLDADCRTFATCPSRFNLRAAMQYCAPGTLFSAENLVCSPADTVVCAPGSDPCSSQPDGLQMDSMRSKENQAAVLICDNSRTIGGRQCEECETFGNSETGCVPISGCVRTAVDFGCSLSPNENDAFSYFNGGILMPCGNGTIYDQATCGCVTNFQ